jgi:hypothetical protein
VLKKHVYEVHSKSICKLYSLAVTKGAHMSVCVCVCKKPLFDKIVKVYCTKIHLSSLFKCILHNFASTLVLMFICQLTDDLTKFIICGIL